MTKEIKESSLSAAQSSHITAGVAETLSETSEHIVENLEHGSEGGESLHEHVVDSMARGLKHSSISDNAAKALLTGGGGSLLILSGLYSTYRASRTIVRASGLSLTSETIEKALDRVADQRVPQGFNEYFAGNIKTELVEAGICNSRFFVKSENRKNDVDVATKFEKAVGTALTKAGVNVNANPEILDNLTKSIAQDLGFVYSKENGRAVIKSYNGQAGVQTSRYDKVAVATIISADRGRSNELAEALETSGIIEEGRCVKAPTLSELMACCQMADIKVSTEQLEKLQQHLAEKSEAVAEVPTLTNRINMNQKLEGGLIGAMGMTSLAAGAIVLLASFAGLAVLAAASFGIAVAGVVATGALIARDTYVDAKEGLNNNKMSKQHAQLKNDPTLTKEQRLEHAMQEKLYAAKAKENAGVTFGNSMFAISVAITALVVLSVLTGGGALGIVAAITIPTFAVGAGAIIASKKLFGAEADGVAKDLKILKELQKAQESGKDLTKQQVQEMEKLQDKYKDKALDGKSGAEVEMKLKTDEFDLDAVHKERNSTVNGQNPIKNHTEAKDTSENSVEDNKVRESHQARLERRSTIESVSNSDIDQGPEHERTLEELLRDPSISQELEHMHEEFKSEGINRVSWSEEVHATSEHGEEHHANLGR